MSELSCTLDSVTRILAGKKHNTLLPPHATLNQGQHQGGNFKKKILEEPPIYMRKFMTNSVHVELLCFKGIKQKQKP